MRIINTDGITAKEPNAHIFVFDAETSFCNIEDLEGTGGELKLFIINDRAKADPIVIAATPESLLKISGFLADQAQQRPQSQGNGLHGNN